MKYNRWISLFLAVLMLLGSLPLGVFAVEGEAVNAKANYSDFRGEGMTPDANGVMVYDDLDAYYEKSQKDVQLSTEYKTEWSTILSNGKDSTKTETAYYEECPYLYADYAIYFDKSMIEKGTTVKIRHGLSMMDSVYYEDSTTHEIVKSEKSPIQLSKSYKDETYNAGFGMVYEGEGDSKTLKYTTRYYEKKGIIFYIINHSASERIGQEDDVSILADYISEGYVVVTVDFKSHKDAVTPFIENALISLRAMFDDSANDAALKDLGVTTDANNLYFLPEGCRLERDVWYWDPSIFGVEGTMEKFLEIWNTKISCQAEVNQALEDPKKYDTLGIGNMASVEDMIQNVTKKDGVTPIEYKQSMDIIYPSQPKSNYEAPVYIHEATAQNREKAVLTGFKRVTLTSFALSGYACVLYDHPFWPFCYRDDYIFADYGYNYGLTEGSAYNARAAVRCAKYLASELGYSDTLVGATGVSKATVGIGILSIKNNEQIPQRSVTADGHTYDNAVCEGDIFPDTITDGKDRTADKRTQAILQPFWYYNNDYEAANNRVSSDCAVTYNSSGAGVEYLFSGMYAKYEKVPMVLSSGASDYAGSFRYWDEQLAWFRSFATEPFLPLTQLDQGHVYPVGYDNEYGYHRPNALIKFFDSILKPEEAKTRAPEVLWVTPLDGTKNIPIEGKWTVGPYWVYGEEPDSYYHEQSIQIRFVSAVDPESVNTGVKVIAEGGKQVSGTWVASEHDALYTFETDELTAGTKYTINITSGVKGANGVALAQTRTVSFTTEGSYLVKAEADTYVSSAERDTAFGSADGLKVSADHMTLVSFKTENVLEADKILLRAETAPDLPLSVNVYALDMLLEDGLTYNTLTAGDAWTNKTFLGTHAINEGKLEFNLSALADLELGDYVTLAFESAEEAPAEGYEYYVYDNDFETPPYGKRLIEESNGTKTLQNSGDTVPEGAYTVVDHAGGATDGRKNNSAVGKPYWDYNIPASPYIWARTGGMSRGYIRPWDGITSSDNQAFRVEVNPNGQNIKFYNTMTSDRTNGLTAADIGKTFRVTFDIYPTRDLVLEMGVMAATGSVYVGDTFAKNVTRDTWTPVTYDITLTAEMVTAQAGMVAVKLNYPQETETPTTEGHYTYFDNLHVEELAPGFAAEKGAFMLLTTNKGFALNASIDVKLDEETDLESLAENAVVRNETTRKNVKGEWIAVGEEPTTEFAFVTKGLEPASTYTVSVNGEVIRTVKTEGDYALRPTATSYVSTTEPEEHFGLDEAPVLDNDKLGVVAFSAKTLKNADVKTLYLDVDTKQNADLRVYALTDVTLDETLCYNTVKEKLTETNLIDSRTVAGGKLAIDLSALSDRTLGDSVTFVFEAITTGQVYYEDFNEPAYKTYLLEDKTTGEQVTKPNTFADLDTYYTVVHWNGEAIPANKDAVWKANEFPASPYIWRVTGAQQNGYLKTDASISGSQVFRVKVAASGQNVMFYNMITKNRMEGLTSTDVGKTFRVTFDIYPTLTPTTSTPTPEETVLSLKMGVMAATGTDFVGTTFTEDVTKDMWTTKVTYDITITDEMLTAQAGMVAINLDYPNMTASPSNEAYYVYFDNLRVEEVITVTLAADSMMIVTENASAVEVTEADNPVADEILLPTFNDFVLYAPIEVTLDEATELTTFKKNALVHNENTGKAVKGEWIAVGEEPTTEFAFVTKGLEPASTYTVSVAGEPICTVNTEGDYALRPIATSYVSMSAPETHFGLDETPVLDGDKLGVVAFSTKTLKNADVKTLYLDVDTAKNTYLHVYALTDVTLDSSLCYNTVKEQLTVTNQLDRRTVADGKLAIDLSALPDLTSCESVTLVFKAGYTFFNDFETPALGTLLRDAETQILVVAATGGVTNANTNSAYKDKNIPASPYIWCWGKTASYSSLQASIMKDEAIADTQIFRLLSPTGGQYLKFYNTMTDDRTNGLTDADVGKTFRVTFDIYPTRDLTLQMGVIAAPTGTTPVGTTFTTEVKKDTWTKGVTYDITLTQEMIEAQAGMVGIYLNYPVEETAYSPYTYFDNLRVEELIAPTTLAADGMMIVTENASAVEVTEADNPVLDEEMVLPKIDSANIGVGGDITLYYYATATTEAPQMRFTVNGKTETVSGTKQGDKFVFAYRGIAPQGMGENIYAELIENGEVVATYDNYSVEKYCKDLLAKTATELGYSDAKCAAMKTAVADLLAYGAAAQKYTNTNTNTDALVNKGVEGASEFTALEDSFKRLPGESTLSDIRFTAAGVYFDYTNHLYFKFDAAGITEDNFVLRVTNQKTETSVDYTLSDFDTMGTNKYLMMTDGIAALDFGTMFTVELVSGDTVVQTLEYGINSYVYSMQNDPDMAELAQRTYCYGVSAKAYNDAK